jgi:mannose-1-phosphate guanylyltransferase
MPETRAGGAAVPRPLYALILAGGSGTRLWPYSRRRRPKQLLPLIGELTMLEATVERLAPLIPPEHVFVLTNEGYVNSVRKQLPQVPPSHVVGEPAALGTAPAVALGAALVREAGGEAAVMFVLPADHVISPAAQFREALSQAAAVAAAGQLVTFGIRPTAPETGYGYVELGAPLAVEALPGLPVRLPVEAYQVARFVEKPDRARAEAYVLGGRHLWNSGMFGWTVARIWAAYAEHLPNLASRMDEMLLLARTHAADTPGFNDGLAEIWNHVTDTTTIDYGIMERDAHVACVPAAFGWSDIGSWAALGEALDADAAGNVVVGPHVGHNTRDTVVYGRGGRLIATIGVENLIIVDTEDALLICARDQAQSVKEIVAQLTQRELDALL